MKHWARVVVLCAAGAWSGTARADATAPGGLRGLLRAHSADTAGRGVLEVGAFSSLHTLEDSLLRTPVFSVTHFQLGYGVSKELELGIALPLRAWHAPSNAPGISPQSLLGFGDLEASGKLQLPLPGQRLRLAMLGAASFPTGSSLRGMTSATTDVEVDGLLTLDLSHFEGFVPTRLHFNLGYRWNRNETRGVGMAPVEHPADGGFWPPAYPPLPPGAGTGYNDPVLWRAGLEFGTPRASLFAEFSYDEFRDIPGTEWRDHPALVTPGVLFKFRDGLNLKGAVDISLQTDEPPPQMPQLPHWRFTLGVTWQWALTLGDRDHDGIPDKIDACPDEPEDFDGFQDADGCPDLDNDGDGIPDRVDLAPNLPEDKDGFEDQDGRPDLDNDGDGIPDDKDQCPNDPEDFDGDRDTDGCPDDSPALTPAPQLQQPAPNPAPAAPAPPPTGPATPPPPPRPPAPKPPG